MSKLLALFKAIPKYMAPKYLHVCVPRTRTLSSLTFNYIVNLKKVDVIKQCNLINGPDSNFTRVVIKTDTGNGINPFQPHTDKKLAL